MHPWGLGVSYISLVKPVKPVVIFLLNQVTYVHKYYECDLLSLKLYMYVAEYWVRKGDHSLTMQASKIMWEGGDDEEQRVLATD